MHKLLLILTMISLAGCANWGSEKQERETREHLDSQMSVGMSFDAFEQRFPLATMLEGEPGNGAFLVTEDRVCWWCSSPTAFKRSKDVFARVVNFSDGKLVSIDPVEEAAK